MSHGAEQAEQLASVRYDFVAEFAVDMTDEAYTASTFLVLGGIKTLTSRHGVVPRYGITLNCIEAIGKRRMFRLVGCLSSTFHRIVGSMWRQQKDGSNIQE